MSKSQMRSRMNLKPLTDALDHLGHLPDEAMQRRLDRALRQTFDQTQEKVDVVSGRLKASGTVDSYTNRGEWFGRIAYGGGDAWYVGIEVARGDEHHPFDHVNPEQEFEDAINRGADDV